MLLIYCVRAYEVSSFIHRKKRGKKRKLYKLLELDTAGTETMKHVLF